MKPPILLDVSTFAARPPKGTKIYFIGIGGTGMAATAALVKEMGYQVYGSDKEIYPPMSEVLANARIKAMFPFAKENITCEKYDAVVVGNVISRGHIELEACIEQGLPLCSFPQILNTLLLKNNRYPIVVTGTHGKTTTTSLLAWLLENLFADCGYWVGGACKNLERSYRLGGRGSPFAIEGDEYDTVFFDKDSKFHHYAPRVACISNLEFDHADIFKNLDQVKSTFIRFIESHPDCKFVLNGDIETTRALQAHTNKSVFFSVKEDRRLAHCSEEFYQFIWDPVTSNVSVKTQNMGDIEFKCPLVGIFNVYNYAAALTCLDQSLPDIQEFLKESISRERVAILCEKFLGVKRRLDLIGKEKGISVYEDFAHHPTAIRATLEGLKSRFPQQRLAVYFEPANATGRRSVFIQSFAEALSVADQVLLGPSPVDLRIAEQDRMNIDLLGRHVKDGKFVNSFKDHTEALAFLSHFLRDGDIIVFMSSSGMGGIQHKLLPLISNTL